VFENMTDQMLDSMNTEIQRTVAQDPRLQVNSVLAFPRDNGLLIELEIQFVTSTDAERLSVFFDLQTRSASWL
jgi:hypothetical protein